jgi:hypothetical protein
MAWTAPADKTTGDVVTAAIWNAALGATGNMAQTAPAKVTTAGDIVYATGANALTRLGIGSTGDVLTVSGGVPTWAAPSAGMSTGIRNDFRSNRRRQGEWAATQTVFTSFGFGRASGNQAPTVVSGETINGADGSSGAGTILIDGGNSTTASGAISPNKSPRFLGRVLLPTSSANLTSFQFGMWSQESSLTANGAYLRIATTGNVFFVTRQGGSETTTDLGVLSRVAVLGFEIESSDAGVTWVCRNQAGTTLATHTTNVPTVTTGLLYGFHTVIAANLNAFGPAYMMVEGTFA